MNDQTQARLNAINRAFYEQVADDFDATRGTPWPGWERLLPHLKTPLSVLDVGCGNGRFGVFLAERLGAGVTYHGIDNNAALLDHARAALAGQSALTFTLESRDIVKNPPNSGQYDLVALFGVLHHIPGAAQRLIFMRTLAGSVKAGGLLAFACWRFYEYERFRERVAAWPADLEREADDYLLDWRRGKIALRYCHYVNDDEHAALIVASGLQEIETYRADGQAGDVNRYSVLQRS